MSIRATGSAGESNGTLSSGPRPVSGGRGEKTIEVVVAWAWVDWRACAAAELAKLEATRPSSVRAQGAGMMAAAGVLGLFVALSFAGVWAPQALDLVMPTSNHNLIVALVFAPGACCCPCWSGAAPCGRLRSRRSGQQAVKEDVRWAKQQIAR